jgi:hypothetical protein
MKFPGGFTDIQYYGIPEVLKRKDTILASQTGPLAFFVSCACVRARVCVCRVRVVSRASFA